MTVRKFLVRVFFFAVLLPTLVSFAQQPPSMTQQKPAGSLSSKSVNFEKLSEAANSARTENRDVDAIHLYQEALKIRPDWQEGLWYLSTLLYQKEQFADSRDLLRLFVAGDPQAGPGWALLGMSEYQTREYTRALDHLQRAVSVGLSGRKDLTQSVLYFTAALLIRFERYDDSMNLLGPMSKAGENSDLLVEPLGLAALRLPLLPQEIPPDRRDMIRTAGQSVLAVASQQQDEAEKLLSGMVAAYPNEAGVHFLYGAFLMDVRPDDGIREMKRELEISPSHLGARLRLAEEYLKEQQLNQALPLAEEAVKLDPASALAHMILGEVLVAEGEVGKGIGELETAREETPSRVRIHWDLLRAYTSAGRPADAKREKDEIEKLGTSETRP
jgi:tetratricopeptide (TPR) repeat protein